MISKILKILKESISSVANSNLWEMTTKDIISQDISGYRRIVRQHPVESSPKFFKGQLVSIRYHHNWKHLHKEIGIILEVNDFDPIEKIEQVYFYEVLVSNEKITILERFLDGYIGNEREEESSTRRN